MIYVKDLVIRAIEFAALRHSGQTRKGNEKTPYINHPIKVVSLLLDFHEHDSDLLSAAALHDVIEDTAREDREIQQLEKIIGRKFGNKVLSIIWEVTDNKQLPFQERKQKQIQDTPHLSQEAKKIKIADKICNITDLKEAPPVGWSRERKKSYIEWATKVIEGAKGVNKELEAYFAKISRETYKTINSSNSSKMSNSDIQMVITDLDGTLFNDQQETAREDLDTLKKLASQNIVRVVATGRNLYSALNRLKPNFPIDYLIFSSGAGIYDWKTKRLIHSNYLPKEKVEDIALILINAGINFMIHELIPENHKFVYYRSNTYNPDFERRFQLYKDFAEPLDPNTETYQHSCQIIAITNKKADLYDLLDQEIQGVKIIRATSPLDGVSIWIEVLPEGVSKGHGVEWLCRYTDVDPSKTLGIGNDYNDLDLLKFTAWSYVVDNAPEDLKKFYPACRSNEQCGFTDAVKQTIAID